jgi:CHAT domain-containing protein
LLSLWEVEDRSTAEFMGEFYKRLMKPMRKADALRLAMLALRERYEHPYYWAAFKLTGRALVM